MTEPHTQYSATVLDVRRAADAEALVTLRAAGVTAVDTLAEQLACLRALVPAPGEDVLAESPRWVYYPWRAAVVRLLGPVGFALLRLDRNRYKVTHREQQRLRGLDVGIVGLSVGHAVALALAMEGCCGTLRLSDHDTVELSNLNRIPATVLDLGLGKAVVAARRIAEIDPYLAVSVQPLGVTTETVDEFLAGLDLVVEECDSLDAKVLVRERCRARRIPVLMETSDRGLLDVERFDLEPDRPLFHGLLGDVDSGALAGLTPRQKVPLVLRILGAADLSSRMAASLVELGATVSTWPQLGGDVLLGAASVATAVRRLGLGRPLPSGRVRIDLEAGLDALAPVAPAETGPAPCAEGEREVPVDAAGVVAWAASAAPSGGNAQPWRIRVDDAGLSLRLDTAQTSTMDVRFRGSCVALGGALLNARVAAAAHGLLGPATLSGDRAEELEARLSFAAGTDEDLAGRYRAMLGRGTNRHPGSPRPLEPGTVAALHGAADAESARLALVVERPGIDAAAAAFAAAERVRFLDARLNREMTSELRWPGQARQDTGIDVRSLELDRADLSTLDVLRRPDAMAHLAEWGLGHRLGNITRERVGSSSALAAVLVRGSAPRDFVRGGAAAERVWIAAEEAGLAVQPVSPVFLYGLDDHDLAALAPDFTAELAAGRRAVATVFGLRDGEVTALILRLSHAPPASVRSRRRRAPGTEKSTM